MSPGGELILFRHHSPDAASNSRFLSSVLPLTGTVFWCFLPEHLLTTTFVARIQVQTELPCWNGQPDVLKICMLLWDPLRFMLVVLLCHQCHLSWPNGNSHKRGRKTFYLLLPLFPSADLRRYKRALGVSELKRSQLEMVDSAASNRPGEQEIKWDQKVHCAGIAYTKLSLNWVT